MYFESCLLQYWFWRCKCSFTPHHGLTLFLFSRQCFRADPGRTFMAFVSGDFCHAQHLSIVNEWIISPPRDYATQKPPWHWVSTGPCLSLLNPPGITRSPQPERKQVLSPSPAAFCLYSQSETPLLNGVIYSCLIRWLKNSPFFCLFLFYFNFFTFLPSFIILYILCALWTRPSSIFVFIFYFCSPVPSISPTLVFFFF